MDSKASNGKFLEVVGPVGGSWKVTATAGAVGETSKFSVVKQLADGTFSLKASNGRYVSDLGLASGALTADAYVYDRAEKFYLKKNVVRSWTETRSWTEMNGNVSVTKSEAVAKSEVVAQNATIFTDSVDMSFQTAIWDFFSISTGSLSTTLTNVLSAAEKFEIIRHPAPELECCCIAYRGTLALRVEGIEMKSVGKNMRVMIFHNEKAWNSDSKYRGKQAVAIQTMPVDFNWVRAGTTPEITFPGLVWHEYSFMVHIDKDEDGKLDTNFIGMPQEGMAGIKRSSCKGGPSGGPKWRNCKLTFDKPYHQEIIEMWYP